MVTRIQVNNKNEAGSSGEGGLQGDGSQRLLLLCQTFIRTATAVGALNRGAVLGRGQLGPLATGAIGFIHNIIVDVIQEPTSC